jgi:hypothetical protein
MYLCIDEQTEGLDLENNKTITIFDNYTELGVRIGKDRRDEKEIREKTRHRRKAIKRFNRI